MVKREKIHYQKGNCKTSLFLCSKNSANQFFTHQIGVHSNVMEGIKPSAGIMIHQIYIYTFDFKNL